MSRLDNAVRNVGAGIIGQIILLLLQFLNRSVFISALSKSYLGTNGLFNDILSLLSVAELGLGTAIIYAMYKPMAEGDMKELAKLVNFYRKAYRKIGCVILGVGVALTPFLHYLIQGGGSEVDYLQLIYLLILGNSAVTYFFSYKITVLNVAQQGYIETLVTTGIKVIQLLVQTVFLILTRNYLIYLVIQLICTILTNLIISGIAERKYPEVFKNSEVELDTETKKDLLKNVKALLLHRLGTFFVNGTDNIIISKFLGLAVSGIYSNYVMLLNAIKGFINPVFNALTASVGNLSAMESREKTKDIFEKINFMGFWIACFCSSCFYSLFNPFIYILCKQDASYLFEKEVVAVIVLNFYLTVMRKPVLTFKNAMGLYWYDRWKPLVESLINIVASLILVMKYEFIGVLIGTSISTITVVLIVEPRIVYRYGFETSVCSYYNAFFRYGIFTVLCCWITDKIANLSCLGLWLDLFYRFAVCLIVPNLLLFLCYHRTEEWKYFRDLLLTRIKKKKGIYEG